MKVWFGFIIILELTSRILKDNQYLFDRLSWVYGPALKDKFGNPWQDAVLGYALKGGILVAPVLGLDYITHIPQLHEYTHLQIHGNFDNYTPPGSSMFERAFDSVVPQTSLENEQLQQQVAELQRLVQEQALREEVRVELQQEANQLESFRQFQAWQEMMPESQSNAEVIPEQSYAESQLEIDELRRQKGSF